MNDYSHIEQIIYGMACICNAQELLDGSATREQINERLDQALEVFDSLANELGTTINQ